MIYFESSVKLVVREIALKETESRVGYTALFVCYVGADGKVNILLSNVTNGKIAFQTNYASSALMIMAVWHKKQKLTGRKKKSVKNKIFKKIGATFSL